jgi:microcystin-dependent protein
MSDGSSIFPVGTIVPMLTDTAPPGWLLCNGQEISGNDYPTLVPFLKQDTASGKYIVPDLRGYTLMGAGNYVDPTTAPPTVLTTYNAKSTYGASPKPPYPTTHTLQLEEMPSHQHLGWWQSSINQWKLVDQI